MNDSIESLEKQLVLLEAEAADYDAKINELKQRKNGVTRRITSAYDKIAALRPPNPIPPTQIG